ncbi:peroxisomal biogenesis factor 19 [Bactrocera neohumeralis]|uniref:peroxisomal biogenesis factor 19 n=1 Tax=Bactrocera tryoni TaxID=59916 RepID=UPI001A96BCAC|nr:peroxisomal biogenesis factor 19 [Bactrocera tryoni]XP_050321554.1 peroxisomal biogenesis factor 19 [Bactrocera neohumeralis]
MSENKQNDKKELDELLDNALQDFDKKSSSASTVDADNSLTTNGSAAGSAADAGTAADPDAFFIEQANVLAERMQTLFGGPNTPSGELPPMPQDPDQILAGFKKMAEAAAMTLQGENPATDEDVAKYSDSIAQALKGLQEGSENLSAPVSENDVANMFSGLNLENPGEGDNNMFLPFMEGMMQSLLSAEILLPSIKELVEKYPKYFEQHGDKISAEDRERYEKQLELYKVLEKQLEAEKPDDSATVKREKFKAVLDHMRRLQEFGNPPQEILAETAGDLPMLDPNLAGAAGAGANPQCPMM